MGMIKVDDISFFYEEGDEPALDRVSLEVTEGEYLALIGPNGCGKTTLMRHLNGLVLPSSGAVKIDGMDTADHRSRKEIRRRVGMVFQNPDHQIISMTVEEDVGFGPCNLGLSPAEVSGRVREALRATATEPFAKRAPHTLSGGEKRLVAVAGVLAMKPRYLVLDEPTSSLDPGSRRRVLDLVKSLNRDGLAVIHVTHDVEEATAADRVAVMSRGRIVLNGRPAEVLSRVEEIRNIGLDVPFATDLAWRLNRLGNGFRTDILTLEQALSEILVRLDAPGRQKGSDGGRSNIS